MSRKTVRVIVLRYEHEFLDIVIRSIGRTVDLEVVDLLVRQGPDDDTRAARKGRDDQEGRQRQKEGSRCEHLGSDRYLEQLVFSDGSVASGYC